MTSKPSFTAGPPAGFVRPGAPPAMRPVVEPFPWRPIDEWANGQPGHSRAYADLWIRNEDGDSWREPLCGHNAKSGKWYDWRSDELPYDWTITHFMFVRGPDGEFESDYGVAPVPDE